MDEWKVGYLAGMIDGEGSISIAKRKGKRTNFNYAVTIYNTHLPTLEFLQKEFGGTIYSKPVGCYKSAYLLKWSGHKGKEVLRVVAGKLSIKKELAELYLLFPLTDNAGPFTYNKEDCQLREAISLKMRELNQQAKTIVTFSEPYEPESKTEEKDENV